MKVKSFNRPGKIPYNNRTHMGRVVTCNKEDSRQYIATHLEYARNMTLT